MNDRKGAAVVFSFRPVMGVIVASSAVAAGIVVSSSAAAFAYNCADYHVANIVRLTNEYRQENGLASLKCDDDLVEGAQAWADAMRREGKLEHQSGYYAENVAWIGAEAQPDRLVRAWIDSPGHRQNMLNREAEYMGAGWSYEKGKGTYGVQRFW